MLLVITNSYILQPAETNKLLAPLESKKKKKKTRKESIVVVLVKIEQIIFIFCLNKNIYIYIFFFSLVFSLIFLANKRRLNTIIIAIIAKQKKTNPNKTIC
jgi:hypothetical protein